MSMKKIIALILSLVIFICSVGCNNNATTDPTTSSPTIAANDTTVVPTESPTQAEASKPTQAPTEAITQTPAQAPTPKPTEHPTQEPTQIPTQAPTKEPTQAPTQKSTQVPTQKTTQAPAQQPNNEIEPFRYVEEEIYDNVTVYFKLSQVFISDQQDNFLEMLECDGERYSWVEPIDNMVALGKGTAYHTDEFGNISEVVTYRVNYQGKICYILEPEIILTGSAVEARDGKTHRIGEILYKGKYHNIVITGDGRYCCTDGCDGRLGTWVYNPMFSTFETVCEFADSSYIDPNTFVEYPLCFKPIYEGKYGAVYCISNKTNEDSNCYKGFHVVRNKEYQKMTLDDITDPTLKEKLTREFGVNANFKWYESVAIYTFEGAKLQADSYEDVCGGRHFTYISIAGG